MPSFCRKLALCLYLSAACLIFSGVSNFAVAQVNLAIVDVQALLSGSDAAKSIQSQLQEKRKEFQSDISGMEQKLKDKEQDLVQMQQDNPEAFSQERKGFEQDVMETRKLVQSRRQSLEEGALEAMNVLRKHILEVVSDIADENGYDIVLSKQNVVIGEKDLDITKSVMKRLNKQVKTIDVTVE